MDNLTIEQVKKMDRESLESELSSRVYKAALLLEQMEDAGFISGNGHHKAQRVADYAVLQMDQAWK